MRSDEDQLRRDAAGLGEKAPPLPILEMAVEVAREDAVERSVLEGKSKGVAADEARPRRLFARLGKHPLALVEADDLAAQMTGQEAGPTGDVERSHRREISDQRLQELALLLPAGAVAIGVEAPSHPPVVVLGRAPVVVQLHGS